jgi:hypothetical protein
MCQKIKLLLFCVLSVFLLSSFPAKSDVNILLNGNFADDSNWSSLLVPFGPCAGLYTDNPCITSNSLVFSYPDETVSQQVNLPSGTVSRLIFSVKNTPRWFNDGLTLTLSLNNGNSVVVSCPSPCTTTSFGLKLDSGFVGATLATVSIYSWGNGWGGNYGPQISDASLNIMFLNDVQSSLQLSANRLKNVYALQTAVITSGLTYDCSIFDKNDICVSAGGRYNRVNTGETKAANGLLIGAYRVNPDVRLGAWVDQNLSVNTDTGVSLSNSKPMFGVFGVWNANASGQGLELKVAASYGDKDLTVTRDVVATSEAGTGTTRLNTQGVSAVVSYNLPVNISSVVSPYLGMRYTKLRAGGYTEKTSDAVTTPLTYSELKQESSTALAGVKLSSKLMPNFGVFGGIGAELDTTTRGNNYSATGVDGLTPIAFNPNIKRLRGSANAGFYLDIDKTQRISLSTVYREEAFTSTSTLSSMLTYTAGF